MFVMYFISFSEEVKEDVRRIDWWSSSPWDITELWNVAWMLKLHLL